MKSHKLIPFAGGFLLSVAAIIMHSHLKNKETSEEETETKEAQGGCGCGKKKKTAFRSEMNQDVHAAADGELARLNPTIVEGAEDIMGAEGVGANDNYVFMQPWNDLTPQKYGPYYSPFSVPNNMDSMPTNPRYYDGSYASSHQPHGIGLYDVANDARPQYQFPDYYSVSYNPLASWRPADDQVYTTV